MIAPVRPGPRPRFTARRRFANPTDKIGFVRGNPLSF